MGMYWKLVSYLPQLNYLFLHLLCKVWLCRSCSIKFYWMTVYSENLFIHRPMEEQRQRYGPPLYSLTSMVLFIRLLLLLAWERFEVGKLWDIFTSVCFTVNFQNKWFFLYKTMSSCSCSVRQWHFNFYCCFLHWCFSVLLFYKLNRNRQQVAVLEQAVDVYTTEFERFLRFIRYYFCFLCFQV